MAETFSKSLLQVVSAQTWKVSILKNPIQSPLRRRLARIEHVMLKFKKLDIANPFHQYSNSFKKHSGREKFSLGADLVGITSWPSTPFRASNCRRIHVMFNEQAAVFYRI